MTSSEWKALLQEEPDNELLRISYAKALFDEKNWEASIQEYERLLVQEPDFALAWALLARAKLNAGDREGARRACEEGMPAIKKLNHEIPLAEVEAVLAELDSAF